MSLFKILKGDSSRIDVSVTPFHDGYAYFTPDDGGFYIDSEDDGVQRRIRINPPCSGGESTAITTTLTAAGWTDGAQTLAIEGVTAESNGVIGVTQSITAAEMEAAKKAELYVSAQDSGTLTVVAFGDVPTCDIPVVIMLID
ncbi:MAG: hypothetical protein Q4A66_10010 [Eubacteriales bacterium]|nr:hypothetical protein [Eubacteriales bacterium]